MAESKKQIEKNTEKQVQGELIFALDIGTRSVIGIVGEVNGDMLKVLGVESMEHTRRAMLDGQVEDIGQVAKIAKMVKERLEEKLGVSLTHVCVAAAGRSLKTRKESFEIEFEEKLLISRALVSSWEMNAVKQAQAFLLEENEDAKAYTCVGYSVMKYYLDGYPISTLIDHRGTNVRIDVVATFLPDEVIGSLYEVTARIGLTVTNLTLEPIAAMNAIIPQELRLLNLALVDIGAGTSDIAISNDGSVVAYTMVTIAGDEVSEAIVKGLLVDFSTAERIKQEMSDGAETIHYQDVIGFDYDMTSQEVFEVIKDCTDNLCSEIANEILQVNGQKPSAVFLVGGGSRLANMAKIMAGKLDIPESKVAVGGSNYMKRMLDSKMDLTKAEYATPIGIAITAMNMKENSSISVMVNDVPVSLFKNSVITVMDALLISGYKQNQLIGRNGQSVTFELNGSRIVARGGIPVPAQIQINGAPASLTTPVNQDDDILVKAAEMGADAKPKLSDYTGELDFINIDFNGEDKFAGTIIKVNDVQVNHDIEIKNLDKIEVIDAFTVGQFCIAEGYNTWDYRFCLNGREVDGSTPLNKYDMLSCVRKDEKDSVTAQPEPYVSNMIQPDSEISQTGSAAPKQGAIGVPVDEAPKPRVPLGKSIKVTVNGTELDLPAKPDGASYMFFDMLNFVDIDPTKPQGDIALLLNGSPAEYMQKLADGDEISIRWVKR